MGTDPILRRVITVVMATAVVVIILSLVALGLYFKSEVETGRRERAEIATQLDNARKVIVDEQERQGARSEQTQKAIDAAVRQLVDEQTKAIQAQFDKLRAASAADHAKELAELKRLQDDLTRRISAIVSGPPGPAGAPGAPGQPGAKGQCQLLCL